MMREVRAYTSRLSDPASRKYETFSYLPAMSPKQIRMQVEYIVSRGWSAAIEHIEPGHTSGSYWYMWKLPMFGETGVDRILAEAESCRRAYPADHVRLVGYDKYRQTLGAAMVVFRGKSGQNG
jgi:ribulose-bisphosphate carboxylase small chain